MTEQILNYYQDEKNGSLIGIIASLILLLIATLLWKNIVENPVAKGLSTGLFVAGILILVIGISGIFYNNKKMNLLFYSNNQTQTSLQQSELARMDKVMNQTFKYAFITFGVLIIGFLIFTLFTRSWYWKGFGMAMLFFVALLMLSDTFSMYRNGKYLETIKNLKITS